MRRFLIVLLAVLAVLAGADTLLWRRGTQQLAAGFAAWAEAARADGWTVDGGPPSAAGWPFAAELEVPRLALTGGLADGLPVPLAWRSDRLRLHVDLLHARRLLLLPEGRQRLRLGAGAEIPLAADRLQVAVPLDAGATPGVADLAGTNLRIGMPGSEATLTVALLAGHGEWRKGASPAGSTFDFALTAEEIAVPMRPSALGSRVAAFSAQGTLKGPLPPQPDLAARAAAWRDAGGTLELRSLALGWGPLGLMGNATLGLDGQLQPTGSATLQVRGQNEALEALAAAHVIRPTAARAAAAVLGLLARPPEGGGTPDVEVPLTLRDRTLSFGLMPLAKVPELLWPGPIQPATLTP